MSDFSDWLQNNWIDLARLGVQTAILVAVLKYGRRLLAAVRASQEQIGALLKLSVADGAAARELEPEHQPQTDFGRERVVVPPEDRMLERAPVHELVFAGPASMRNAHCEREQSLGGRVTGAPMSAQTAVLDPPLEHNEPMARGEAPVPRSEVRPFTPWVSAPTVGPDTSSDFASAAAAMPAQRSVGVQSWLNAPIRRESGPGPIKKMVRWLQSPVRTHPRPAR